MAAGKEIKRLRGNISAQQAASLIGVDVEKLRKWEQRDANPKDTGDIVKVEQYFGKKLDQLQSLETFQFIPKPTPGTVSKSLTEEALWNLTESSRKLADAILIDAQNRKILIEERSNLVQMLQESSTANALQQTERELISIREAVVELLLDVAGGKRFRDRTEAGQVYSKRVAELMETSSKKDTQKSSGKKRIAK